MHRHFSFLGATVSATLGFTQLAAVASAQFTVVIPNGTAAAEGSTSNAFPWGRGGTGLHIQTVYDSSHFTAQGITFPIIISRLRWRPNTNVSSLASSYPTGATVQLSTCPLDQAAVATTFASNQGADLTTVFSGPVSWPAAAAVPGPCPFLIDIPFTTNFIYDPNLGDLNIETDLPVQAFTGTGLQLDVQGTAPLASRVYLSTGYPGPAGTIGLNHGVVVEVTYLPASGLFAGFTATPTAGPSPLNVSFTDHSFSSDPGGVTSWAWDFDGDNVIDSTLQNPTFNYTGCGSYNVSLTVTDASHAPNTLTRPNFVVTDQITAGFTYSLLAPPNVYQFTDTTTPAATGWAWDFNNDGITDSTAQNPIAVLTGCAQTVRLTATRNCRTASVTRSFLTSANSLSTIFTGGNSGASGWIVFYDVNVTNPQGVTVCGFDTNSTTAAGTPFSLDIYVTPGTYVGNDNNVLVWRRVGTASGTTAGPNLPSAAALAMPFHLPSGSYGFGVLYLGATPSYTNGNGTNQAYNNGDLALSLGAARSTLFAGGSFFTPRVWNGAIHYDTASSGGAAGYGFFGPGCAGSLGITNLTPTSLPQTGATVNVNLNNLPLSVAIMVIGFSNTTSGFGPLPIDMTFLGAPGCFGRVSPDATQFMFGVGNAATWSLFIPVNPSLLGMQFFNQALVLDPPTNTLGAVMSDASSAIIGI